MKNTLPSNRSFGLTLSGAFTISAIFYPWTASIALVLLFFTIVREEWLTPLNRAWMKLGELMGRVVNPITFGVIFFGVFTPTGVVMRLAGRDVLTRKWDAKRKSYWVKRDPTGLPLSSFENMF